MPNYGFNVIWSDEDEAYVATCPAFPDLSAFGESPEEALQEARVVLGLFIEEYEADGVPLPEPTTLSQYSGRCLLRMPKHLHGALARMADQQGVSTNALMVYLLSLSVGGAAVQEVYLEYLQRFFESLGYWAVQSARVYIETYATADEKSLVQDPVLSAIYAHGSGD